MSITLSDIKTKLDDYRSDITPGTVSTSQEGVRAINASLDWLRVKHRWPTTIDTYMFDSFYGQESYPLDSNYDGLIYVKETYEDADPCDLVSYGKLQSKKYSPRMLVAIRRGFDEELVLNRSGNKSSSYQMLQVSSTDDGTTSWAASGDAGNLRTMASTIGSSLYNVIAFDYTKSTLSAVLTATTTLDISNNQYDGKILFDLSLPSVTGLSSIELELTDGSANTSTMTATTKTNGNAFTSGPMQVGFLISDAVETGSFDYSDIDSVKVTLTFSSASSSMKNCKLLAFAVATPSSMEISLYTNKLVYDTSAGTYLTRFTGDDDTDVLNLPDDCLELVALGAAWQLCKIMEKEEKAERYRLEFCGQSGDAGMFGMIKRKYPSTEMKEAPASYRPPFNLSVQRL